MPGVELGAGIQWKSAEGSRRRTESGPITPGVLLCRDSSPLGVLLLPVWQSFHLLVVSAERPECLAEDGRRENQSPVYFLRLPLLLQ